LVFTAPTTPATLAREDAGTPSGTNAEQQQQKRRRRRRSGEGGRGGAWVGTSRVSALRAGAPLQRRRRRRRRTRGEEVCPSKPKCAGGAKCACVCVRCRTQGHTWARWLLLTVGLAELLEIGDGLGRERGEGVGDEHKNRLVPTLGLRADHRHAHARTRRGQPCGVHDRGTQWGQLRGKARTRQTQIPSPVFWSTFLP